MKIIGRIYILLVVSSMTVAAQTVIPDARVGSISLSVVSVKPSSPKGTQASVQATQDSIIIKNNPLSNSLSFIYAIKDPRTLTGVPDWAMEERFDISAKIEEADLGTFSKLRDSDKYKLLQSVLVERFGLKSHTETKEFTVYALVVAKGGSKLTAATGKSDVGDGLMVKITGQYKADIRNASMENFCNMILTTEAQQMTADQTHLTGRYDFILTWTRPDQQGSFDAPEIFTAVKDQLGLELVKRKIPETVVVIDEIHRPTPN